MQEDWLGWAAAAVAVISGLYGGYKVIWPISTKLWNNLLASYGNRKLRRAEKNRQDPHLHGFLERKYSKFGVQILTRGEWVYPVAVFPAPLNQTEVNTVIGNHDSEGAGREALAVAKKEYRRTVKLASKAMSKEERKKRLYDHSNFAMSSIVSTPDKLTIEWRRGSYFDLVDTCYSLEWELVKKWKPISKKYLKHLGKKDESFSKQLKLRRKLHEDGHNPLLSGARRVAGLAVSGLVAYRDKENNLRLFLLVRSKDAVANYSGWLHVVPAGQMEPLADLAEEMKAEKDGRVEKGGVALSFYREYLEELFSNPDVTEPSEHGLHDPFPATSIYSDQRLQYLFSLIKEGKARFLLTGVTMNLLCLQPEISTLLYINTPDWFKRHTECPPTEPYMRFKPNREFEKLFDPGSSTTKKQLAYLMYSNSDGDMIRSCSMLSPSAFVPNGAAAFWLGIDRLREILKQEESGASPVADIAGGS